MTCFQDHKLALMRQDSPCEVIRVGTMTTSNQIQTSWRPNPYGNRVPGICKGSVILSLHTLFLSLFLHPILSISSGFSPKPPPMPLPFLRSHHSADSCWWNWLQSHAPLSPWQLPGSVTLCGDVIRRMTAHVTPWWSDMEDAGKTWQLTNS